MPVSATFLPYQATGSFSALVTDYLAGHDRLRSFFDFGPTPDGLDAAIAARRASPVDRQLLADTLERQYAGLDLSRAERHSLQLLRLPNTFTVCTAHQPNLMTGYLYFIYKILHAIILAETLAARQPSLHFVPVYYMGSEDNDLDELGVFRYEGKKYVWDGAGQQGAVGRMDTASLGPLLEELFRVLGPPGPLLDELKGLIQQAYGRHSTIAAATRYLLHQLFGRYGLLVLDPDDAGFKRAILPIMEDDLLNHTAHGLVSRQAALMEPHYKAQAYPRHINLFYLTDGLRERIEREGEYWTVAAAGIRWDREQLLAELQQHPERFSPNVILRGLLQETIMPNVAFIGGGAEVAYWLQLGGVFRHYGVFLPSIQLRQSALWIEAREAALMRQLGLEAPELFMPVAKLEALIAARHNPDGWQTQTELGALDALMQSLRQKALRVDASLERSADAALARMRHQLEVLEQKMLRAEKKKHQTELERLRRLKAALFPGGGLQERTENFLSYYLKYGPGWFDTLKAHICPLEPAFLVLESEV